MTPPPSQRTTATCTALRSFKVIEVHKGDAPGVCADADVLCVRIERASENKQCSFVNPDEVLDWLEKASLVQPCISTNGSRADAAPMVIVFLDPLENVPPDLLQDELERRQRLVERGVNVFDRNAGEGGCSDTEAVCAMLAARLHIEASSPGDPNAANAAPDFSTELGQARDPGAYGRFPAQSNEAEMDEQLKKLAEWYKNAPCYEME